MTPMQTEQGFSDIVSTFFVSVLFQTPIAFPFPSSTPLLPFQLVLAHLSLFMSETQHICDYLLRWTMFPFFRLRQRRTITAPLLHHRWSTHVAAKSLVVVYAPGTPKPREVNQSISIITSPISPGVIAQEDPVTIEY